MKLLIQKTQVPQESEISKVVSNAYYSDCYCFSSDQKRSAIQVWLDHASKIPAWVNTLMALRNKVVRLFGLKNVGHLGALDANKSAQDYKEGDKVGIFTVLLITDNEVILGETDKHLDVKVSIHIESNKNDLVSMSSVVHVHNFLGKLYMLFVKPMHQIIVPASISRAESSQ